MIYYSLFLVCNAGYYKNGSSCLICPGNTLKATVGNLTSCPTVCETKMAPNLGHTACGKLFVNVENNSIWSSQWVSMKHRYFKAWEKIENICQENDIAEIYFIMNRAELCFSFCSTSKNGSDIYRFPNIYFSKATTINSNQN